MKITRIKANPRVPGHLIIEVDGTRFASLPVERVQGLGLKAGETLDELRAEELRRTARAEEAYSAAMRMLAARPRSVFEMMQRLRAKKHDKPAIAEAVGRLEEKGLLNDEEFARQCARSRAERGYGSSRILSDLLSKGVDRHLAEVAIAEAEESEGPDCKAKIELLVRKRVQQLGALPEEKKVRRLVGYLARRGFGGGQVLRIVRSVVRGE